MSFRSGRGERLEVIQKNSATTRKLEMLLRDFYNKRIKRKIDLTQGGSLSEIRNEFGAELDSIINHFMIQAYKQAADSVVSKFKVIPYYELGSDDHAVIEQEQTVIIDKFWNRIETIERRNQTFDIAEPNLSFTQDISLSVTGETRTKRELNPLVYLNGLASLAIYGSSNLATKKVPQKIVTVITPEKAKKINEVWKWRYTTKKDQFVCDKCRPFDDRLYDLIDASLLPNPPYDKHIHCRCILVLVKIII